MSYLPLRGFIPNVFPLRGALHLGIIGKAGDTLDPRYGDRVASLSLGGSCLYCIIARRVIRDTSPLVAEGHSTGETLPSRRGFYLRVYPANPPLGSPPTRYPAVSYPITGYTYPAPYGVVLSVINFSPFSPPNFFIFIYYLCINHIKTLRKAFKTTSIEICFFA